MKEDLRTKQDVVQAVLTVRREAKLLKHELEDRLIATPLTDGAMIEGEPQQHARDARRKEAAQLTADRLSASTIDKQGILVSAMAAYERDYNLMKAAVEDNTEKLREVIDSLQYLRDENAYLKSIQQRRTKQTLALESMKYLIEKHDQRIRETRVRKKQLVMMRIRCESLTERLEREFAGRERDLQKADKEIWEVDRFLQELESGTKLIKEQYTSKKELCDKDGKLREKALKEKEEEYLKVMSMKQYRQQFRKQLQGQADRLPKLVSTTNIGVGEREDNMFPFTTVNDGLKFLRGFANASSNHDLVEKFKLQAKNKHALQAEVKDALEHSQSLDKHLSTSRKELARFSRRQSLVTEGSPPKLIHKRLIEAARECNQSKADHHEASRQLLTAIQEMNSAALCLKTLHHLVLSSQEQEIHLAETISSAPSEKRRYQSVVSHSRPPIKAMRKNSFRGSKDTLPQPMNDGALFQLPKLFRALVKSLETTGLLPS